MKTNFVNNSKETIQINMLNKTYTLSPYEIVKVNVDRDAFALSVYVSTKYKVISMLFNIYYATTSNVKLFKDNAIIYLDVNKVSDDHSDYNVSVDLESNDVEFSNMKYEMINQGITKKALSRQLKFN
jgi:hypothetical protein